MRPSRNLAQLHNKASHALSKLRVLAAVASSLSSSENHQVLAYVTIECQTTVSHFMRAYFLSCTLFAETESKITISCDPGIRTFDDAIYASACRWKPNANFRLGRIKLRDEPPWHNPNTLLNSCAEISCSNYTDIQAAFSVPTNAFSHLTKFRNFYAHRNDETVNIAKNLASHYSIRTDRHPNKILCTPSLGRPQILILDWIDDIKQTFELLCK
jgi:hypothetical protein